jgi:hypothetical protein
MPDELTAIIDEDVWEAIVHYEGRNTSTPLSRDVRTRLEAAARVEVVKPTPAAKRHVELSRLAAGELLMWLTAVRFDDDAPQDSCRRAIFAVQEAIRLNR